MLISCWSAKGGAGTTVVSAALALVLSSRPTGAMLADLAGDAAAVLGVADPPGPVLDDWLVAGPRATPDALGRLEHEVSPGLALLPGGRHPEDGTADPPPAATPDDPAAVLARLLDVDVRPVVADCGTVLGPRDQVDPVRAAVAAAAATSLLVTRPCYLSLRRALRAPVRPTGVVVVHEPGRALGPAEVEDVLGVEVVACVDVDPGVARAVDAGVLSVRLPRGLRRQIGSLA